MMRRLLASLAILAILWAPVSGSGRVKTGTRSSQAKAGDSKPTPKKSTRTKSARASKGRIKRNAHARREFMVQTGFPRGRPGYVVDHIVPLACGGADAPFNMQWQTVADGKAKDRVERVGC
jgi:phage protein D